MDQNNEILELDLDFNLENVLPDDVVESLGLATCTTDFLLVLLKKGAEMAIIMLQNFDNEDIREYWGIGKRYAPVAYEIYTRFFKKENEPRLPPYMTCNRYRSTKCHPNTIIFWADPDLIQGLYKSLEREGYYASTTESPSV